jgi:hypothetical protein
MTARWPGPLFLVLLALNASGLLVALAFGDLQAAAHLVKGGFVALAFLLAWIWVQ